MKIICPNCKGQAILEDNYTSVRCELCNLDMTYGEYVRYIAQKDSRYKNILEDYK